MQTLKIIKFIDQGSETYYNKWGSMDYNLLILN